MGVLLTLVVIAAVVAVLIWLISMIQFGPPILKSLLILLVVIAAIIKVWPML